MPTRIALRRCCGGSPAAAMPTTIALSPASAMSIRITETSAARASAERSSANTLATAEQRAENAAHDLATELATDAARRAVSERLGEARRRFAATRATSRCGRSRSRCVEVSRCTSHLGPGAKLLVRRLAIDRDVVAAGHRARREHRLSLRAGSAGPTREAGGAISVRCTMPGVPLSSSIETSASPTASSVIACATRKSGLARNVSAAAFTAFWSLAVKARSACCTRLPSCASTSSGTSVGLCVTKNTPTPFERISRTTCSTLSISAFGASSNSRCASSKNSTSFGRSRSPTSGSSSNSSESSQSRKVA